MRRHLGLVMAVLLGLAAPAQAVTIRDLIELTKAGLGEEVLLALVEVDGGVFPVDAETLRRLKEAGVPERVIAAVVRSGRAPLAAPTSTPVASDAAYPSGPAPYQGFYPEPYMQPETVYVPSPPQTIVQEVPVPYYVAVPVAPGRRHYDGWRPTGGGVIAPSITAPVSLQGPPVYETDRPAPASPVYWGNGGRLRPDAWKPASSPSREWGSRPGGSKDGDEGRRRGRVERRDDDPDGGAAESKDAESKPSDSRGKAPSKGPRR